MVRETQSGDQVKRSKNRDEVKRIDDTTAVPSAQVLVLVFVGVFLTGNESFVRDKIRLSYSILLLYLPCNSVS